MPLDQPPMPTSRRKEYPFQSRVEPDIVYIMRPLSQRDVPSTVINRRASMAERAPLVEQMRVLMLSTDLSPWLSPAEISRARETVNALLSEAQGIPDDDLLFLDRVVEPLMIRHNPDFRALARQDESIAYDLRMRNLADTLVAVEEKGERYTWPPDSEEERYEYVRDCMDPFDISLITLESRNLQRVSADTEKNSEPPSMSE